MAALLLAVSLVHTLTHAVLSMLEAQLSGLQPSTPLPVSSHSFTEQVPPGTTSHTPISQQKHQWLGETQQRREDRQRKREAGDTESEARSWAECCLSSISTPTFPARWQKPSWWQGCIFVWYFRPLCKNPLICGTDWSEWLDRKVKARAQF